MDDDPLPRSSLSLRVQVVGWLLLINLLVFLGGGLWLKSTFAEAQERQTRQVFDDLMYRLRDTIAASGEINVQRILEDPKWASVEDALIVDKSLTEVGGQIVHYGVALNPVGASMRAAQSSTQRILKGLHIAMQTGQPVEVAGGRAIQVEDKDGLWGAFWYRMPASLLEDQGMFGRLFPWFLISTLLLTGGSFLLLSRLALDPMQRLAGSVRRMEAGDLGARVRIGGASQEVDDLMRGFNAMAEQVETLNLHLAAEVERATEAAVAAEKAALTQKRLAAMGELTAGIAHEINNPLGGLLNAAAALEREDLEPARRERYLKLLRDGLERIRDTVSGLLRFTPRETQAAPVDLWDVAQDSLALVRHRAGQAGIALDLVGEASGDAEAGARYVVFGARNELGQALLNLLANALDALEAAPATDVPTVRVELERQTDSRGRPRVHVRVADNGPGAPPEVLERAADLFFTTKEVGKGTGLGLGIVHRIVDAHDGEISLDSEPGAGFVVSMTLPGGPA